MLLRFYDRPTHDIEERLANGGVDVEASKEIGLKDLDFPNAAKSLGLMSFSSVPFRDTGFLSFDLSRGAKFFLEELRKGPLWVSRFMAKGSYHSVVATGYINNGSYIIYNNPFPGPDDAVEVTTTTATVFCRFITDAQASIQGVR